MLNDRADIVKLMKNLLRQISEKEPVWNDNTSYTTGLKEILRVLAEECGLHTRYRPGPREMVKSLGFEKLASAQPEKEFLLDLMWLDTCNCARLAAEIEWAARARQLQWEDISYDFEKLLYINSPLKLMICDFDEGVGNVLPALMAFIVGYGGHRKGDQYVVLNLQCFRGIAHCYWWQAELDGIPHNVNFIPISEDFPRHWRKGLMPDNHWPLSWD